MKKRALIVVDMQVGFSEDGELPVAGTKSLVPVINELIESGKFDKVIFTKDSHPAKHCSFNDQGGLWPSHCIVGTQSWEFVPCLKTGEAKVIRKAQKQDKDAYSGFDGTELDEILKKANITDIYVCGVATDYCDKATALDAVNLGYKTHLLAFACKEANPETGVAAITEMERAGIDIIEDAIRI